MMWKMWWMLNYYYMSCVNCYTTVPDEISASKFMWLNKHDIHVIVVTLEIYFAMVVLIYMLMILCIGTWCTHEVIDSSNVDNMWLDDWI